MANQTLPIFGKLFLASCMIASGCTGTTTPSSSESSNSSSESVVPQPSSSSVSSPISSSSSSSIASSSPVISSSSSVPSSVSSVPVSSSAPSNASSSSASSVVGLVTSYNFDQASFNVGAAPSGFSSTQFALVSNEQAFSGAKSVKLTDTSDEQSANMRLLIDDTDSGQFRASVYLSETPNTDVYLTVYSGDWTQSAKVAEILIKKDGRVVKRMPLDNGTGKYPQANLLGDAATRIALEQWHELELNWQDISTEGTFNIGLNASNIASADAVNTDLVPDRVEIRFGVNDNKGVDFGHVYIDNFYIRRDGATSGGKQGLPAFTSTQQKVGYFIDAPVAGIGYETNSAGRSQTGEDGAFIYGAGEDITFFIGDLRFPSTKAKATITPLDIANATASTNQMVTNIARLLQSLDTDNDTSTGIKIKPSAANAATQINLRASHANFETAVASLMQATNSQLVSVRDARSALNNDLNRLVNRYAVVSADGTGGQTVDQLFAAEFGPRPIEHQECRNLNANQRIKEVNDGQLNRPVFEFIMRLNEDVDCSTSNTSRQRLEVKTYNSSPESVKGREGEWHTYQWKFKLQDGFTPSFKFTHIFQMKAVGGDEKSPILTLTPRKGSPNKLEVVYNNAGSNDRTVAEANLSAFDGTWVTAYIRTKYNDENGYLEVELKETLTGDVLLSYVNNNIDMFRDNSDFVRPKWGIYRDKSDRNLRNETARFTDFCVAEGTNKCPE